MLVVIALMAVVTAAVGSVSRQLPSVKLKRSSVAIIAAIRTAFARATITSKHLRLAMNFDDGSFAIEEAAVPMLVQSKDLARNGGAAAVTDAERLAQEEADRFNHGFTVPKPRFKVVEELCPGPKDPKKPRTGPCRKIESGITFREVQTGHDDTPISRGRGYLYFWPGGLTERANIQLRIGDSTDPGSTLTLIVSPLTGSVRVKTGPVTFLRPLDDRSASEREDTAY